MRHRQAGFKLGRDSEHRLAMFRNMAISLFTHGQITTTMPKAKAVQPFVEKLITMAKKGDLASRRRVVQKIGNPFLITEEMDYYDPPEGFVVNKYTEKILQGPRVVSHLFSKIAPRYAERAGGYTRIIRLAQRRIGDGADLVVLQLVGDEEGPEVKGRHSRRRAKQNNRTAFAAKLRKANKAHQAEPTPAAVEAAEADAKPEQTTDA